MRYLLKSPGGGAYRVQLSQVDGPEKIEAVLAGHQDQASLDLPPGEYWSEVETLGGGSNKRLRYRLQLNPDEPLVNIADLTATAPTIIPRREPAIRMRRLERPSRLRTDAQPTAGTAPIGLRGGGTFTAYQARTQPTESLLNLSRIASAGLPAHHPFRTLVLGDGYFRPGLDLQLNRGNSRFSIALSEDATPDRKGAWRRPRFATADIQTFPDSVRVRVRSSNETAPERGYRQRMSIAIENLPVIRVPLPMFVGGVTIDLMPVNIDGRPDFAIEISAHNPDVQALVAALTELPARDAVKIVQWNADQQIDGAIRMLAEKRRDLWAATAAALILVKTRVLPEFAGWSLNLARLAPHIPDASIAAAWVTAARGLHGRLQTESAVMKHLKQALRIGAPTFTAANSLCLELLNALKTTALSPAVRREAQEAYVRATRRTGRRIYQGPYMLWEQPGEQLRHGELGGARYLPLITGTM